MQLGSPPAPHHKSLRIACPGKGQPLRIGPTHQQGGRGRFVVWGPGFRPELGRIWAGCLQQAGHLVLPLLLQLALGCVGALAAQPIQAGPEIATHRFPLEGIPFTQQHRQFTGQIQRSDAGSHQQHVPEPRVEAQLGQALAVAAEAAVGFDGPQLRQQLPGLQQGAAGWRIQPNQLLAKGIPPGR